MRDIREEACQQYKANPNFRLDRPTAKGIVWIMATMTVMEHPISQVALLHRVSNIVSSELSLDEMLGEIVGLTAQVTECDACLVYLLELETGEIVLRASQVPHANDLGNLRMKMGEGVTGWVAEHKAVVALPSNAAADVRFKRFPALIEDTYEAFLSVPLVSGGEVIGVVNVHHRQAYKHSPEEVALLTFVGEQMGGAISKSVLEEQNTRLREETLEMKRQLETRKLVERAKGLLQHRHSLTEEEAYLRLRNESRRLRRPMKDLAEAIILAEDLSRKSENSAAQA
jgi:signal transduction protein with GAF and PtsI domain